MKKGTVVFICGAGRSGSTLLERLLGQDDNFCSVGEMMGYLWDRGLRKNQLCGCEKPFRSCPFWEKVLRNAFTGTSPQEVARRANVLKEKVARIRHTPLLAFPSLMSAERKKTLEEYTKIWNRILESILKISESDVIIENSKIPIYGWILYHVDSIELRIVHLVRDPRGVSFSWQRKKKRPEIKNGNLSMKQKEPLNTSISWNIRNLSSHLFECKNIPYERVKYEELAEDTSQTINGLKEFSGADTWTELGEKKFFKLEKNHTVSGNPMRFDEGEIEVKTDEEWREGLSYSSNFLVSAITSPLLFGYEYHTSRP